MVKIYTKTGDDGTTSLFDGSRVLKNNHRVDTYGDIDETNALLGVAAAALQDSEIRDLLLSIQRDLFALGAQLANPKHKKQKSKADFDESKIVVLEKAIDKAESEIDPIKNFILHGGSPAAAYLDLARTVCRRAERKMVELNQSEPIDSALIVYVNRLSDLLFMLARLVNKRLAIKDIEWV